MAFSLFFVPDTEKVFGDTRAAARYTADTALGGEAFSLQAAFYTDETYVPVSVTVTCETLPVAVYGIGCVPIPAETWGVKHPHEAYPDMLIPRAAAPRLLAGDAHLPFFEEGENEPLIAGPATTALWITLNEAGAPVPAGEHVLTVSVTSLKTGEKLATSAFYLRVLPAKLPAKDYLYTNWFHYDCLAEYYGVELWSEPYWQLLAHYLKDAAKGGQTMILMPAVTPALDTVVGGERTCVQLVDIFVSGGTYRFDFSRLARFVRLARACGLRYLEHPHFFSQWGAAHAPNIYGEKDGKRVRLFGWETDAGAAEYAAFLRAYIPAFLKKAREWGVEKDLFFHISDEPNATHEQSYARAVAIVRPLLAGYRCGDALSDIRYFENGSVPVPIVGLRAADDFYGKCPEWLLYHTGRPDWPGSRRLITVENSEIRALGVHLFYYRAAGFLHWGYNYWYGMMSKGLFDPARTPCAYKNIDGASFIVYPGRGGTAQGSVRAALMRAAFEDYLALKLLEKRRGYEFCVALCTRFLGETPRATVFPTASALRALRAAVHAELERQ